MLASEIKYGLGPDGRMLIMFPGDPPRTLALETGAVDRMIQQLGWHRRQMKPAVPEQNVSGVHVEMIPEPLFSLATATVPAATTILQVRDPRFGWLNYGLSDVLKRRLANALLRKKTVRPSR